MHCISVCIIPRVSVIVVKGVRHSVLPTLYKSIMHHWVLILGMIGHVGQWLRLYHGHPGIRACMLGWNAMLTKCLRLTGVEKLIMLFCGEIVLHRKGTCVPFHEHTVQRKVWYFSYYLSVLQPWQGVWSHKVNMWKVPRPLGVHVLYKANSMIFTFSFNQNVKVYGWIENSIVHLRQTSSSCF